MPLIVWPAVVVAVAELLLAIESVVVVLTLAVFEIVVPSVTEVFTLTTSGNVAVLPAAKEGAVQVIEPFCAHARCDAGPPGRRPSERSERHLRW